MIQRMLHNMISSIAKSIKGDYYQLDSSIPITSVLGIAYRRFTNWARSVLRGINWKSKLFMGRDVELRNRRFIKFGHGVTLGKGVLIDGLSRDGIVLGNHVNIGDYTRLEASGTITDIGLGITIGNNSGIGSFSFIGGAGGVLIGNDVIMGQYVSFHPENHNTQLVEIPIRLQGVNRKGIIVGDNCWIGAKVTFLDGATVGKGCVIAAGAVVRGEIPPYSIAAGVPARIIKSREMDVLEIYKN